MSLLIWNFCFATTKARERLGWQPKFTKIDTISKAHGDGI